MSAVVHSVYPLRLGEGLVPVACMLVCFQAHQVLTQAALEKLCLPNKLRQ